MSHTDTIKSIFEKYNNLSNKDKAFVRRCNSVDELKDYRAAYITTERVSPAELRILYVCPYLEINDEHGVRTVGALFNRAKIKERRIKFDLAEFNNIKRLLKVCVSRNCIQINTKALVEIMFWKTAPTEFFKVITEQQIIRDYYADQYEL